MIEPYFLAVKELFIPFATKTKTVRLKVDRGMHDTARHFAGCDGSTILVAPEMGDLGEETVLAMLAHEFGHAVDFLYPGEYVLVDGDGITRMPATPNAKAKLDARGEQAMVARMRHWRDRDEDTVEKTADAIAEKVLGRPIGYCGPCLLQCFGGEPRPVALR